MKKFKKLVSLLIAIILVVSAISMSTTANSTTQKKHINKVTSSMTKNRNFKKLVKRLSTYCIGSSLGVSKKTITVKNNNKTRLSVAAYVRYGFNDDYSYTKKELKNTVFNLFGKKVKKIECYGFLGKNKYDYYDEDYIYTGGDLGNIFPIYSINKVTKKGKIYTVKVTGKIKYSYDKTIKKQCKITLKAKKNKKSSYKFVATSIKYRKCKGAV